MKIRMLTAPALVLALFAVAANAQIRWTWSFGTEAGYIITDGTLVNGTAPAGTYNTRGFAVTESRNADQIGSMANGEYNEGTQPGTGFLWNGSRDTQWFRAGGRWTNGATYYLVSAPVRYLLSPRQYGMMRSSIMVEFSNSMTLVPGPNAELSADGGPWPGGTVTFQLEAKDQAGKNYLMATSLGRGPIPIGSRKLYLSYDGLFATSVFGLAPTLFINYAGQLDANGEASASVKILNEQALVGVKLHTAYLVLDPSAPDGVSAISETESFTIQ